MTCFEEQLLGGAPQEPVEFRHRHRDGGWVHVEAVATNLVDDPAVRGIVVNTRDVTDRRRAELLAADQARILERVARGAPLSDTLAEVVAMVEQFVEGGCGAIALLDEAAHSLRVVAAPRLPPACVEVLDGYTAHPATAARLTSPGLVSDVEIAAPRVSAALRAHGFESWWSAPIRSSGSDPILGVAMMFRTDEKDPTEADEGLLELAANVAAICVERTRAATQLEHLALHDPLTGLANRAQLIDRLGHAVLHPRTGGPYGAVLFLDVDRFKTLNDRLGHAAGDNLLREIGARIRSATRPGDLVARLGGDEFLVLCEGLNDPENAVEIAGRVLDTLRQRVDLGGTQTSVTASIGVALFQGGDPMDVLRNADAAMYRAKELGRDRFELFDETLRIEEQARRVLDEELRALAEGDVAGGTVVLAYDPIVQITTRHLVGFDVRASWEHPQRGIVLPGEFLATADDAAVAALLAERVWSDSLRRVQRWRASLPGADGLVVGIPLTVRELTDVQVVDRVASLLAETETAPEHVLVQVAESALIEDAATVEMSLRALRDAGVRIALGEFGAAHSSLLHLERFAIDVVRIDAAFIAGMLDRPGRLAIVRAVVDLAKELGISTIAEGVRTAAESERLGELGCDLAQGPWYSRALTGSEAETLLARSGPKLEVVT